MSLDTFFDPKILNGVSILLVDDDPDTIEVLKIILDKEGATVFTASSVSDALNKIQHYKPDVTITDIEMPEGGGYQLIKSIRELEQREHHRYAVIALSAHSQKHELKKIEGAGFNACLEKPIAIEQLISSIRAICPN